MATSDKIIERSLEEELFSNDDDVLDSNCSDVEVDIDERHVLPCDSASNSEIEGDEEADLVANSQQQSSTLDFSSDDDVPMCELRSRPRKNNYFGKDRFRWSSTPTSSRARTFQHNIVQEKEGVKQGYKNVLNSSSSPLDIWNQCFTDDMLEIIVLHTNEKIRSIEPKYTKQVCVQDIDLVEVKAFIRERIICIMSKNRFEVLLNVIRFDDSLTRETRRETDPLAPISQLFNYFIKQCQEVYAIGSYACVDEMLVAYRGRCRFKMYMPKKSAKYGLKIMCLMDARTRYLLNAYIYTGRDSDGLNLPIEYTRLRKPTQAILRLISCIEGTNRNITTDNWFTSIELANCLKGKQLTLVGTMRKNQREISSEFLPSRQRQLESSLFGFTSHITITSFVLKKKVVVVISSMHHASNVDEASKKPEIILFYNETKFGVDLVDQRCSNYLTGRRTRRWPLAIFYTY
ncbi:unnamed protein product [Euphydryas editha]|uniref:PiggyBac transposable element-derived protein domain-containing protein n=1 Tax=Euphydryas editha TaxID=104508 RepID=A0AAU9TKA7_EUPED|nr:unnamed protein product [Euphydryas editha]